LITSLGDQRSFDREFRKRVYKLEETDHDPANYHDAMDRARNPHPPPSLDAQDPGLQSGVLVRQSLGMTREQRRKCIEEFM